MKQIPFSKKLSLSSQTIQPAQVVQVKLPAHHIMVIDVSGSMYSDLPELRRHLKNKLVNLVGEGDTVSLVWFSGKGQYGILQEGVPVRTLSDLSAMHNAIDKYIQAVGLTGFKEPLEAVDSLIDRLKSSMPNSVTNLLFMTDGYDNQWSTKEILSVTDALASKVDSATIIEYGWNCNRDLLSKMAETIGGNVVFSEHFDGYQIAIEGGITRDVKGGKKILVDLEATAKLDYAFSFTQDGTITSYIVNDKNQVMVPETLGELYYFSEGGADVKNVIFDAEGYIGLATLTQRMKSNEIFEVIGSLGDVYLVNRFVNAFSKQDYSDFQAECVAQAIDPSLRFKEGVDFNAVPKEDAYTVIDLLNDLAGDATNRIYPLHESFGYKRIGSGSKQRDDSVKFDIANRDAGVPVSNIVFNESRPNASLQVRFEGMVTLPEGRTAHPKLPAQLPSFIYRNYTIIRDGIVHTRVLPVSLSADTIAKLVANGAVVDGSVKEGELFMLDISSLPVINRQMVREVNAKETFETVGILEQLRAGQKVFKYYRDQYVEKKSEGFSIIYGDEAAAWLKEIGVTDYNGFNPPSDAVKLNDVYTAKELDISIKGVSSLPSVKDVLKKIEDGKKLTLRESLLQPAIVECTDFIASTATSHDAQTAETLIKAWLDLKAKDSIGNVRKLNKELSKIKFAIIVGHVWFNDLPVGEGTMSVNVNGISEPLIVTATLKDKEIGGKD